MTEELRVVITPSPRWARIVAFEGCGLVLSARLPQTPWHRRALPTFLEALGRWHHLPVRAVLVVDARVSSSATSLYPNWFADFGGQAYELEVVDRRSPRAER